MTEATGSGPRDAGGAASEEIVAACAFSATPGVGGSTMARLVDRFGSLAAALDAGPLCLRDEASALGLGDAARAYLEKDPDLRALGRWAVEAARAAGAHVVVASDPRFPAPLRTIPQPPGLLYVRGRLEAATPRVAVVGSREADAEGLELARRLGEDFARAGVQVVSGGARGIDAAAHAGALWGAGTTIAVLGCGIDVVYPSEHAELFARIAAGGGAVVTEHPPGTPGIAFNFPRRNRIISGLSSAVVVVRAGPGSGALQTADYAAQQGRTLFAVPGDSAAPLAEGPNDLLRRGRAAAAPGARAVLEALGWTAPDTVRAAPADPPRSAANPPRPATPKPAHPDPTDSSRARSPKSLRAASPESSLEPDSARVLELLEPHAPLHADEVAARAALPVHEAVRRLTELTIKGLAVQRPGKYFLRRRP